MMPTLPLEIINKIFLYIPNRYPFLDDIKSHFRPEYTWICEFGERILTIRTFDEDGNVYQIIEPTIYKKLNGYNYLLDDDFISLAIPTLVD